MVDADKRILAHSSAIRRVTIDLLDRLPVEMLAQTGKGEDSTIGRTFLHIAGGQSWWLSNVMREGGEFVEDRREGAALPAIRQALQQVQDRMVTFFSSPEQDRMGKTYASHGKEHLGRDVVQYLAAHEVHHVGRIVAALRQLGFKDVPFMPRDQPADRG